MKATDKESAAERDKTTGSHERQTRQKTEIQAVFARERRPLSPYEAHRLVVKDEPHIGLATVYRTIKRLVEEKKLVALDISGLGACYEIPGICSHHAHFMCRGCNRVFELDHERDVPSLGIPAGFSFEGYDLILRGLCAECSR